MTKLFGLVVLGITYFSIFNWLGVAHSHKGVFGMTLLISCASLIAIMISFEFAGYWRKYFPSWNLTRHSSSQPALFFLYVYGLIVIIVLSPIVSLVFEAPTIVYYITSWIVMLTSAYTFVYLTD